VEGNSCSSSSAAADMRRVARNLANMSHELAYAADRILGLRGPAAGRQAGELGARQRTLIRAGGWRGAVLLRLINDLRELTQLNSDARGAARGVRGLRSRVTPPSWPVAAVPDHVPGRLGRRITSLVTPREKHPACPATASNAFKFTTSAPCRCAWRTSLESGRPSCGK